MVKTSTNSGHNSVDKGWAWVILAAVFTERLLASTVYLSGIYNVVFLEEFSMSKSITAWCGALHISMMSLIGPVASFIVSLIGPRKTMILGTTFTVTGYLGSAFAPNLFVMFITYGIFAGAGFSFTYVSSFVILSFSFKRYRTIAYGIVTMAIGMGGMIFAPLLHYLISEYGYRGSMIITAGIISHMYIASATLRPISDNNDDINYETSASPDATDEDLKDTENTTNTSHSNDSFHGENIDTIVITKEKQVNTPLCEKTIVQSKSLDVSEPLIKTNKSATPLALTRLQCDEAKHKFNQSQPDLYSRSMNAKPYENSPIYYYSSENLNIKNDTVISRYKNRVNDDNKKDLLKALFLQDLFSRMSSDHIAQSHCSIHNLHQHQNPTPEANTSSDAQTQPLPKSRFKKFINSYKPIVRARFIIYCITLLLFNFGAAITYIHFPAFTIANGSTMFQAAQVVSVLGIVNIISRLLAGMSTSNGGLDISLVFMCTGGLAGLVLCIGPPMIGSHFFGQILIAIGYALYSNSHMALMGPITIELVGMKSFTEAYGVELFMEAIGIMIGPPLAGIAYDLTGSYNYSLLIGGLSFLTGSVVMMLIPMCSYEKSKSSDINELTSCDVKQ